MRGSPLSISRLIASGGAGESSRRGGAHFRLPRRGFRRSRQGIGARGRSSTPAVPESPGQVYRTLLAAALLLLLTLPVLQAAPQAELWPRWEAHNPDSARVVDHSDWGAILEAYLVTGHPSGVNRFRYGEVSGSDRERLRGYIESLEATPVSQLNRDEQYAYWFNFYNALTIELILDNYPVDSIRDIGGLFSQGPFDQKLATVEGEEISLNDIEHRILRPIWRDPRIHYGVNCASIGCPNLLPEPFTGVTVAEQLERAATEYINHPRGVSVGRRRLTLSSIYEWFQEDFGGELEGVLAHLREYAEPELRSDLDSPPDNVRFEYDWSLNEP